MHKLTILNINNKNEIFYLKSCPSPFKIITMGFGTSSITYVALFDSWRVSKVTSVLIECKYYYNQQIHVLKKPVNITSLVRKVWNCSASDAASENLRYHFISHYKCNVCYRHYSFKNHKYDIRVSKLWSPKTIYVQTPGNFAVPSVIIVHAIPQNINI